MKMMEDPRFLAAKEWALRHWYAVIFVAAIPGMLYFGTQPETKDAFRKAAKIELPGEVAVRAVEEGPGPGDPLLHVPKPAFVKGIYLSAATAGYKKRMTELTAFVDRTEVNAMVIDIKDERGGLAFIPQNPALAPYVSLNPTMKDLQAFTRPLHEKGIYLIARLFVFQDPFFVEKHPELAVHNKSGKVWSDRKGQTWLDPASKDVWKYTAQVAREAYAGGFDEIQLDYIRFLTDGRTNEAVFPFYDGVSPKHETIKSFFAYMDRELRTKAGIPISADLFGLTMMNHDTDMNIGQKLEDGLRHFDAVSPMVYPSHYPVGFLGYQNPAAYPYEVVRKNMDRGNELLARLDAEAVAAKAATPGTVVKVGRLRPWVQDFDIGAEYTPAKIKDQMRAIEETGGEGWLFWNARNVYTESAFAVEKTKTE